MLRRSYKIWCLASDDYLLHFEVYAGKEDAPSDAGATVDTVLRMTAAYQHQKHVLYTDNWSTSPALLHALAQRGILCPQQSQRNAGHPSSRHPRSWIQRQKGDATVAVWRDQKAMWLLYNHCSPGETASLDRWNDAGRKVSVGCPRAIRDYFYGARSVDVLSQLHYSYLPGRRCWPRLAWWLLDMCVINAFQLWSKGQQHLGQLQELMHELLQQLPSEQMPHRASSRPNPAAALAKDHYSVTVNVPSECVQCSDRSSQRKQTRWTCAECNKHMCAGNCFRLYHCNL